MFIFDVALLGQLGSPLGFLQRGLTVQYNSNAFYISDVNSVIFTPGNSDSVIRVSRPFTV
jgi:hypothetical protein